MMRSFIMLLTVFVLTCTTRPSEEKEQTSSLKPTSNDKEIVCFVYHRFGDNRFPSTNISLEDFKSHLAWLTDHQYQVLNLSEAIEYLSDDTPKKKTAVITIDDGYKSFFENGLPLLLQYQFPATLFINTETVGAGDYMNWAELKCALQKKIEIGNHTHTHDYFLNQEPTLRYMHFKNDIETAQQLISENLGITPQVLAYPYGEFDQKMKEMLQSMGFAGAAAQNSGVMNGRMDTYQIPRFPMSEHYAQMFEEKATMQSLKVMNKMPNENLIPSNMDKPLLTLTINTQGLLTDQLQCFAQGGECQLNIIDRSNDQLTLTLQATHTLAARRRTLYTLTVPDSTGNWHWFSHLWINNSVK